VSLQLKEFEKYIFRIHTSRIYFLYRFSECFCQVILILLNNLRESQNVTQGVSSNKAFLQDVDVRDSGAPASLYENVGQTNGNIFWYI